MTHFLRILTRTARTRTRIIRFLRGTREKFKNLLSNLSILSKIRMAVSISASLRNAYKYTNSLLPYNW